MIKAIESTHSRYVYSWLLIEVDVDVDFDHLFIRKSLMWGKLQSRPIQVRHFSAWFRAGVIDCFGGISEVFSGR